MTSRHRPRRPVARGAAGSPSRESRRGGARARTRLDDRPGPVGVPAGAASVAGLVAGVVSARQRKRLQAGIHGATQATLTDLAEGFRESQQSLGAVSERTDHRADERQREAVTVGPMGIMSANF